MKGIELPINVLVIVAIAVIVLLGVVALFFIGWGPFGGGISLLSLKNMGCSNFSMNYRCGLGGMTMTGICLPANSYLAAGCATNNLQKLCSDKFNVSTAQDCCGCV